MQYRNFKVGLLVAMVATGFLSLPVMAATPSASLPIIEIIQSIEKGWETGNGVPFRQHFLDFDGARYIESGGQNEGLNDLITHHVEPEGDTFETFDLTLSNIETHIEGDFAWALADVELKATFKNDGRELHRRGYETFLFRRVNGEWKVVHTHSSTRAPKL